MSSCLDQPIHCADMEVHLPKKFSRNLAQIAPEVKSQ